MVSFYTIKCARLFGLSALLAALPFSVMASTTTTVDFSFDLSNSTTGTGYFTYDPSLETSSDGPPAGGPYADGADGLEAFDLTYNSITYNMGDALDAGPTALPIVYTGDNSTIPAGYNYGVLALWVVSGSCSGPAASMTCTGPGGGASIIGVGRNAEAFLISDATTGSIVGTGSQTLYNFGVPPGVSEITGAITSETVTPEPAFLPVTALGLAGLWFVRRRRALR
jgi:MYXO-CTERM domain-containing protein